MDSSPTSTRITGPSTSEVSKIQLYIEIVLVSGFTVKKQFELPQHAVERCIIHGRGPQYSIELTHRCVARSALYDELVVLLPYLVRKGESCWFHTLNKESNTTSNCLFDGVKLKMNVQESQCLSDFGICFPRAAFVEEREKFGSHHGSMPFEYPTIRTEGAWVHRHPSDSERLLVNREGYEVMYFCQPPQFQQEVTITKLRNVICSSLSINDPRRVILNAGPFYWDVDFQENGKDVQHTYFLDDIVVDGRHMRTVRGSALIYVLERSLINVDPS
ncbi:uncharacterized protein Z520_07746 [Fonsecaea multimorphosa CBS 102226]|uniref:Uncharacterized protein n=1 Tax=Fonsecaea multimorphosa CBS 102226 TaxID=1442371 RepID=A0A0D2H3R6_9EURO|nr:uncharacterized protein Z520_07746 [Fonsecaea multimorphosa CBS 102226]KIX96480.1 hypothetical protein Z520_07746 [Fonsecaea multimorphosa CBS 102226]OAL28319.1 hypothetical protein AYO22_03025 [Fonsecaea multimorphosa]